MCTSAGGCGGDLEEARGQLVRPDRRHSGDLGPPLAGSKKMRSDTEEVKPTNLWLMDVGERRNKKLPGISAQKGPDHTLWPLLCGHSGKRGVNTHRPKFHKCSDGSSCNNNNRERGDPLWFPSCLSMLTSRSFQPPPEMLLSPLPPSTFPDTQPASCSIRVLLSHGASLWPKTVENQTELSHLISATY